MKTPHIAQQLITSFAAHGDQHRFRAECDDKANRLVEIDHDDGTTAFIFLFPDFSRVEVDPSDGYIRAFAPSKHLAQFQTRPLISSCISARKL